MSLLLGDKTNFKVQTNREKKACERLMWVRVRIRILSVQVLRIDGEVSPMLQNKKNKP